MNARHELWPWRVLVGLNRLKAAVSLKVLHRFCRFAVIFSCCVWFSRMGRKTYLLSLLGLLLISCKCILKFLFAFAFAWTSLSLKFCKLIVTEEFLNWTWIHYLLEVRASEFHWLSNDSSIEVFKRDLTRLSLNTRMSNIC